MGSLAENAKPVTTRNYILRSILDNKYNEPELIKRTKEDYELMGILYVILALIFTNERAMHDGKAEKQGRIVAIQLTFRKMYQCISRNTWIVSMCLKSPPHLVTERSYWMDLSSKDICIGQK